MVDLYVAGGLLVLYLLAQIIKVVKYSEKYAGKRYKGMTVLELKVRLLDESLARERDARYLAWSKRNSLEKADFARLLIGFPSAWSTAVLLTCFLAELLFMILSMLCFGPPGYLLGLVLAFPAGWQMVRMLQLEFRNTDPDARYAPIPVSTQRFFAMYSVTLLVYYLAAITWRLF